MEVCSRLPRPPRNPPDTARHHRLLLPKRRRTVSFLFWVLAGLVVLGGARIPAGESRTRRAVAVITGPRDLTLSEAVAIALRQNPEILAALQNIERARGQVIEVRAQALPQVTLSGSYQQLDPNLLEGGGRGLPALGELAAGAGAGGGGAGPTPSPTPSPSPSPTATPTPGPTPTPTPSPSPSPSPQTPAGFPDGGGGVVQDKSWQITIQVQQVLYAGGRIAAGIKMAKLAQDEAIYRLRDTVDRVIARVRRQFYQVQVNQALISVQEESVTLLESQVRDQRERYEAGTVPRFNVLQAEVALANARPALIQARNQYRIAQLQLARTLGYETRSIAGIHEPFRIRGRLTMEPVGISLVDALWQARERRPSLKAQRQQILIEIQDIALQRAGYKPTLQAQAGYTVQNSRLSDDLTDVVSGWFFGVQGNWAIFDGFETFGRVKQARARFEQTIVLYEDAMQQIDLEVQEAWANLEQARETVAGHQQTIVQADEALRLARERLGAGVGTQLDVLNAAVSLTQSRSTELEARFDYNAALAEFDRATASATVYTEGFDDPLSNRKYQQLFRQKVRILEERSGKGP